MTSHTTMDTQIGRLTLVADQGSLTAVYMGDHRHQPEADAFGPRDDDAVPLPEARRQLTEYFAGERTEFDLPLTPAGTEFQQRVWTVLRTIPYGRTWSYGELAAAVGNPKASRAVGSANGRNPISIIVPCHRVIGSTGAITGYGGGIERKQALLDLEARANVLPLG